MAPFWQNGAIQPSREGCIAPFLPPGRVAWPHFGDGGHAALLYYSHQIGISLVSVIRLADGKDSGSASAEACEKSSRWLWKESCVTAGVRKLVHTCTSPTPMI